MTMQAFELDSFLSDFRSAALGHGFTCQIIAQINGDPIEVWTRSAVTHSGSGPAARLFVSSGIHGDEPAGPRALLEYLQTRSTLSNEIDWVLIPAINPGGLRRGTRENDDGIDLNRDFLHYHTAEVRALVDWYCAQTIPPRAHFSLHEDWEAQGFYMYAINTGPIDCYASEVLAHLRPEFHLQAGGPVDGHELTSTGLIAHDAVPDEPEKWPEAIWLVKNFPTLSFTFEAPGGFSPQERVSALRKALEVSISLFLEKI